MMNPKSIYERLTEAGEEWADKHEAAELLEGTLKTMHSQCAMKYKQDGCAMNEAEHRANFDGDYIRARRAAIEARKDANKAKVRYRAAEAWFEAQRTAEASHRAASRAAT